MLKAIIVVIAICASGAAFWIKSSVRPTQPPFQALVMPSIEELHTRAHVESLPVREVKEPF